MHTLLFLFLSLFFVVGHMCVVRTTHSVLELRRGVVKGHKRTFLDWQGRMATMGLTMKAHSGFALLLVPSQCLAPSQFLLTCSVTNRIHLEVPPHKWQVCPCRFWHWGSAWCNSSLNLRQVQNLIMRSQFVSRQWMITVIIFTNNKSQQFLHHHDVHKQR
eukprot:TRINITY_DN67867_c0_g2_i1.p1 TRINITY_DN67867_c0_g2~~TRINITY_DN67867_c0_g2_i1.p1  ORF type:complete len:160 (+),score=11.05 TRINITY_DN67867_c0_g2_i1:224-703(+)